MMGVIFIMRTKRQESKYSTTEPRPKIPIIKMKILLDLKARSEELIAIRQHEVSKYTITNMKNCYRQFFAFCGDELNVEGKLKINLLRFLANKSNEYYNKQLQALKQLFNYLVEQGDIIDNPCKELKYKSHTQKIVQHSKETLKAFLELPDTSTYAGFRDYVVMLTILDCGIRPNELVQITTENLDVNNCYIQIQEKVSKTRQFRIVPISEFTMQYIKKLIKINEQNFDTKYIFMTYKGEPLDTKELRYRFCQYSRQLGVQITPYHLRHCFAIMFLKKSGTNGAFSLQKIMGHSKLDMTKNYISLATADIAEAHKIASPINDLFVNAAKERRKRIMKID